MERTAPTTMEQSRTTRTPHVHSFDLKRHLQRTFSSGDARDHVRIGFQNWLTTEMMRGAELVQPDMPEHLKPREGQYAQMENELHACTRKDKHMMVLFSMPFLGGFRMPGIDFVKEANLYPKLDYPSYFLQPFHSIPAGWLNPLSMMGHRAAIHALYRKAHRRGGEGCREDIASLVPRDAKVIYDFGSSNGDQATAMAGRVGPDAQIHCIDASPFAPIVGKRLQFDPRIDWTVGLIEDLDLPKNSADVVNIMFVMHECPNRIKARIFEAAYAVLKPGGRLIVTEPPPEDLELRSRGFFEPYRLEWLKWDPEAAMRDAGFNKVDLHAIVDPVYFWTRVAHKPAH